MGAAGVIGKLGAGLTAFVAASAVFLITSTSALAGVSCTDTYSFSSPSYNVKGGQSATITVTDSRQSFGVSGSVSCPATSVDYATSDGTAHAPADYTSTSGTITTPSSSQAANTTTTSNFLFQVPTNAGARAANFNVSLSNPSPIFAATTGSPSSATVTITEPPLATTGAATNVTTSGATLNGTVNANAAATTYYFQYGTSTSYGSQTSSQSAGSGTNDQSVSAAVSGLTAGTTYHFRIVATNADGTTFGSDATFTTPSSAGPPSVSTGPATSVKPTGATVTGTVDPSGQATTYHFDYGTSTAYGHTTASTSAGSGTTNQSVSATLSGLVPNTTYHYRIVATNASGTTVGGDRTFKSEVAAFAGAFAPSQRDRVDGGLVAVRVRCPAGTYRRCVGTLQLSSGGGIGSGQFDIASGGSSLLALRLSARGQALVRQRGSLGVRARVSSRDGAGTRRVRTTTITLIQAQKRAAVLPKFTG